MQSPTWTLDELVAQVASALAVDYGGQASGRVRDLPDRRAVRWYQTLGLVDRPSDWRGRTALYGRRHLLQLAAIKRLQAAGHTLAEVQAELAGSSTARLAQLAALNGQADPGAQADPAPAATARAASARRFWATRADPAPEPAAGHDEADEDAGSGQWRGIQLGPGAILLVDAALPIDDDDLPRLRAAAAPLLAALPPRAAAPGAPAPPPERTDAP
jgi:DNA-binding transcriptional MerR regulator